MSNALFEKVRARLEREEKEKSSRGYDNDMIFKDLSEGTHTLRLVGEWITTRSHGISATPWNRFEIYPASAFEGDDALKKQVNCSNFNPDTEQEHEEKTCIICRLRAAVRDLLYGRDGRVNPQLTDKQVEYLKNITKKCYAKERYRFLCIDRDNPYVNTETKKKGFKIVEFSSELLKSFMAMVKSNPDIDFTSDEGGCDIQVTRTGTGSDTNYTVIPKMKGVMLAVSPLTDEEKGWERPDILKICNKLPDQEKLYLRLKPEMRDFIDDAAGGAPIFPKKEEKPAEGAEKPAQESDSGSATQSSSSGGYRQRDASGAETMVPF